jgi:long-chain acyl-CoA synthetase
MESLHPRTLRNLFDTAVHRHANRPALMSVNGSGFTFNEVGERVQAVSQILHENGIIAGDRVAILSENMPQWGLAFFAITTMGAIAVPVLPDFHPNEILHILRHAEVKALCVSRKMHGTLEDKVFEGVALTLLVEDFSIVPQNAAKGVLREFFDESLVRLSHIKEAALRVSGKIGAEVREEDVASIIYTSGTTGHSKGVMLTHRNLVSNVLAITRLVELESDDVLLSILPLSHTYECTLGLLTPFFIGASIHYLDKPPSASVLLPALARVKPTIMLSVPLVIEKIYKTRIHPQLTGNPLIRGLGRIPIFRRTLHRIAGKKLYASFGGRLRIFTIGGAPLAPEVESFLREAGFPYAIGYGLTETSPIAAGSSPQRTRLHSTGFPVHEMSIRIDAPHPDTGEGEIQISGPCVMKGYYRDPSRTAEVFTSDGWFRTGDLGVYDKDGYLYIKGRLKNMILGPSGKNIYPEEIESTINELDLVLESLVFARGSQIAARVHLNYEEIDRLFSRLHLSESQLREKITSILEDLRKQVNDRLSSFARVHSFIEQREPFEKTPTQKIKRYLYVDLPYSPEES